jgi:hypothetical protein
MAGFILGVVVVVVSILICSILLLLKILLLVLKAVQISSLVEASFIVKAIT